MECHGYMVVDQHAYGVDKWARLVEQGPNESHWLRKW